MRRAAALVGVVLGVGVGGFVGFTALGVGGDPAPARPHLIPARPTPRLTAMQEYSAVDGLREGAAGAIRKGRILSEVAPTPARAFVGPIRAYRRYAGRQLRMLQADAARLTAALRSGDRARARAAWRTAFSRYVRLGAVYGAFGRLDTAIDGLPGGLPRGTRDPGFTGLHRIELGLWSATDPRALAGAGARLSRDVRHLRRAVGEEPIAPLDYATRSHEILEDAQRDFLSGTDVPWSGEGVLATDAAVHATGAVVATLRPLLKGKDATDPVLLSLARLRHTLDGLRTAHGGRLPTDAGLRPREREALDASVGWALEHLQQLPGALETVDPPVIPRLP